MHCSANIGRSGDAAIFFGLSGTGKTTLSADRPRTLIGDDEHGWGRQRRVQFRGRLLRQGDQAVARGRARDLCDARGVSARCWRTSCSIRRRGVLDLDDGSLTENTRAVLPARLHPQRHARPASAAIRDNVVMLTADAFGVLPPISRLTAEQAMYHFLSGYTARVAGTEQGLEGAAGHLLDLLRRAVHAAPPDRLRQAAGRAIAKHRRELLAGQHRLERRRLRRRRADEDRPYPRHGARRARRQAGAVGAAAGPELRRCWSRRPAPTCRATC